MAGHASTARTIGAPERGARIRDGSEPSGRAAAVAALAAPARPVSARSVALTGSLLLGLATTALVILTPSLRVSHGHAVLHAQIATAAGLVALLGAILAAGRWRRHCTGEDLLVAAALAVLGMANLVFTVLPAAAGRDLGSVEAWAPVAGRIVAAALLAGAALFAPARPSRRPARAARTLATGTAAAVALLTLALSQLEMPIAVVARAVPAALLALAAAGFAWRGRARRDAFATALACGTSLLAFAWLQYVLVPSLSIDWFYAGDALKLAAYLVLAAGAVGEILAYQRDRAKLAAVEERGRVARELHDGVAQELAHVLGQARRLHRRRPGAESRLLLDAAERALDESRTAISTLRAPLDESLPAALKRVATELGHRHDLDVRVHAAPDVAVGPQVREPLLRIVGEALVNAARHGGARAAAVELRAGSPPRLLVRDDGRGFDPDPARIPAGSFGLLSMRERAEGFGGELAIRSAPWAGTEIEVTLP